MSKLVLKIYWVLLHHHLEREQTCFPPDDVKSLKVQTKLMSDHYSECRIEVDPDDPWYMMTVSELKIEAKKQSIDINPFMRYDIGDLSQSKTWDKESGTWVPCSN